MNSFQAEIEETHALHEQTLSTHDTKLTEIPDLQNLHSQIKHRLDQLQINIIGPIN